MSEQSWWLARSGAPPDGPYTYEELRVLASDGVIGPHSRLWSRDVSLWRSLRRLFPELCPAAIGPERWLGLGLLAGVFACCLAACFLLVYANGDERLSFQQAIWAWRLAGPALALASGALAVTSLGLARKLASRGELAGLLKVAAALTVATGGLFAFMEIRTANAMIPLRTAAQAMRFELGVSRTGALQVVGGIGVGFGRTIEQALAAPGGPKVLEIESGGGLSDEALRAARAVERHGVTVIARNTCASACLIVLMAAPERLADYDMELEFHAGASMIETNDRLFAWGTRRQIQAADDFLRVHDLDEDVIQTANSLGPSQLYVMSAGIAFRRGILTGLLEGDRELSAEESFARGRLRRPFARPADYRPDEQPAAEAPATPNPN